MKLTILLLRPKSERPEIPRVYLTIFTLVEKFLGEQNVMQRER